MKNIRTLAVTLGIGSAIAWLMTDAERKRLLRNKGKSILQSFKTERRWKDDTDGRYI